MATLMFSYHCDMNGREQQAVVSKARHCQLASHQQYSTHLAVELNNVAEGRWVSFAKLSFHFTTVVCLVDSSMSAIILVQCSLVYA